MRALWTVLALVVLSAATACGGGSSSVPPGPYMYYNILLPDGWSEPAAPIAVGQSVTIPFHEHRCRDALHPDGQAFLVDCGSFFTPGLLTVTVKPIFKTGAPCPVTVVVGHAAINVTRTGPGDPDLHALSGGVGPAGWCELTVTDAAGGASMMLDI